MGERKVKKLIPYFVEYICDECGNGKMKVTGKTFTTYPIQIEHKCENCNAIKNFYGESYPKIVYDYEEVK